MSLPYELRMSRAAQEVLDLLDSTDDRPGVSMPFDTAISISSRLRGIISLADDLHSERKFLLSALDALEGLLANWPDTVGVTHYEPSPTPVLMKDEALKQAGEIIKKFRAEYF